MSYILEALKKSQKERELGRVPTLADTPYPAYEKPARGTYWSIVAVTLAALATLIALYAAFGERSLSVETPSPSMPETTREVTPESRLAGPVPAPAAAASEVTTAASSAIPPEKPPQAAQTPVTPTTADSEHKPERRSKTTQAPVATTKAVAPPTLTTATEPPAAVVAPKPDRQSPTPASNVPPELVQEVRRFEEHLLQHRPIVDPQAADPALTAPLPVQPSAAAVAKPGPTTDEEPARIARTQPLPEPARTVPPGLSDLPEALRETMPRLRLTVHVYAAAPEQCFVIINSRKMRAGDRSRDGLLVEQITPDGAILEYGGQQFFHHR